MHKNLVQKKILNRLLDSVLVLVLSSLVTFCLVRLNITIQAISPLCLIAPLVAVAMYWYIGRTDPALQNTINMIGCICVFLSVFWLMPSLRDAIRIIIFGSVWAALLYAYVQRSRRSHEQLLYKSIGCICLIWLALSGASAVPWSISLKQPVHISAGDPLADLRMNPSISAETLHRETLRLGLERSMPEQYMLWLDGLLLHGDLGVTQQGESVIAAVSAPLRNTVCLNLCVILISWMLAIPAGVLAAIARTRGVHYLDKTFLSISSISLTVPSFLLSILALSVALQVGWTEVGGLTSIGFDGMSPLRQLQDIASHMFLPVCILTFVNVGFLIRQMRGNFLDVVNKDFVRAARARGLSELVIFWRHVFPNSVNPMITLLGFEFASLVSGAALSEMVLAYPGIGALTLEAARKMDINLIMFNLLLGTGMLICGNLLADLLLNAIDPRTRGN